MKKDLHWVRQNLDNSWTGISLRRHIRIQIWAGTGCTREGACSWRQSVIRCWVLLCTGSSIRFKDAALKSLLKVRFLEDAESLDWYIPLVQLKECTCLPVHTLWFNPCQCQIFLSHSLSLLLILSPLSLFSLFLFFFSFSLAHSLSLPRSLSPSSPFSPTLSHILFTKRKGRATKVSLMGLVHMVGSKFTFLLGKSQTKKNDPFQTSCMAKTELLICKQLWQHEQKLYGTRE